MILINHTLSFATDIEQESVQWLQATYKPLLEACPLVSEVLLCRLTSDAEVQDTYVIQIRFLNTENHTVFHEKYEYDFMCVLHAKFQNNFGIFTSKLEHL